MPEPLTPARAEAVRKLRHALAAVYLTPATFDWLAAHDPKALEQIRNAAKTATTVFGPLVAHGQEVQEMTDNICRICGVWLHRKTSKALGVCRGCQKGGKA